MIKSMEDSYIDLETMLETQVEANQKLLNFLTVKGLVGDFREWESKSRGILGW